MQHSTICYCRQCLNCGEVERDTREAIESLKRDRKAGSGHKIGLGELNHRGECCQMLRNFLTNRERYIMKSNLLLIAKVFAILQFFDVVNYIFISAAEVQTTFFYVVLFTIGMTIAASMILFLFFLIAEDIINDK